MSKQITTGTKIIFKETGDKFYLTQTDTGFELRQIKLSKNVPAESYSFQEFLDLYERGDITIDGFEDADKGLIHSIITNYIYQSNLKDKLTDNEKLKAENEKLKETNNNLEQTIAVMQE